MLTSNVPQIYYAPHLRPEGPRRCPSKGNVGVQLYFLPLLDTTYVWLILYRYFRKGCYHKVTIVWLVS